MFPTRTIPTRIIPTRTIPTRTIPTRIIPTRIIPPDIYIEEIIFCHTCAVRTLGNWNEFLIVLTGVLSSWLLSISRFYHCNCSSSQTSYSAMCPEKPKHSQKWKSAHVTTLYKLSISFFRLCKFCFIALSRESGRGELYLLISCALNKLNTSEHLVR